jgi:hypothetical protein
MKEAVMQVMAALNVAWAAASHDDCYTICSPQGLDHTTAMLAGALNMTLTQLRPRTSSRVAAFNSALHAPHALWDRVRTMRWAPELHAVAPCEVQRSTFGPNRARQLLTYRRS